MRMNQFDFLANKQNSLVFIERFNSIRDFPFCVKITISGCNGWFWHAYTHIYSISDKQTQSSNIDMYVCVCV